MIDPARTRLVAWDVDDVLNNFTAEWSTWADVDLQHSVDPIEVGELVQQLGMTKTEYLASIDRFRETFYHQLKPNEEIRSWVSGTSMKAIHVAVTKTPMYFSSVVADWVMSHFGRWFRGFWVVPSPRDAVMDPVGITEKGQVLNILGPKSILVDDSPHNIGDARASGHAGLLFPQPWNGGGQTAVTLDELGRYLDEC